MMDPKQTALQHKAVLESQGFVVDPQGNVTYPPNGGGFFPPWVWSQSLPDAPANWKIPGSDPGSAWHSMYQSGGPFTNRSQWDSSNATYEGSTDWPTLLGTIGAGGLIGSGIAAAVGGGGAAAGAAGEGVPFSASEGTVGGASIGAGAGGVASSTPAWLVPALKAGVPLAATLATRGGDNSGANANGLSPDQNDLITQLLKLSLQRQTDSAPVHQAAMKLAQGLAPTSSWGDSPRFQQAVQQTTGPGPAPAQNPQIAAAMQRLMGRG